MKLFNFLLGFVMDSNRNFEKSMKRYQCNLLPELLAKAVKELNEPACNDLRLEAIDSLKSAFAKTTTGSKLPLQSDETVLRFLRAKKFNQEKALAMMENYHRQKEAWSDVFEKVRDPSRVRGTLSAGCVVPLSKPALDGSAVLFGCLGRQENMLMVDMIACVVLSSEKLLENEATQINGITVINDLTHFDLNLAKQMTPALSKRFISLMQDAMPIRLKGLIFVNEPKIFDIILAFSKPFMKDKMKKRLHTYGTNFVKLHKYIDNNFLPKEYLGQGPELDSQKWVDCVFCES